MNAILMCKNCFQTLELFYTYKGFITYLYVVILPCILFTIHGQVLCFLSTFF